MAIIMKLPYSIAEIAAQLGVTVVAMDMANALTNHGCKFESDLHVIAIIAPGLGKLAVLESKPELLKHIMNNDLGAVALKLFTGTYEKALADAYIVVSNDIKSGLKKKSKAMPTVKAEASPKGTKVGADLPLASNDPVALRDAEFLYQPVKGTDSGSQYFVVALGDTANCAVRIKKGGKLSFRIEGADLSPYQIGLAEAGFIPSSQGHSSIHLDSTTDPEVTKKAVGALLFATGIPFNELAMDVVKLIGKGA